MHIKELVKRIDLWLILLMLILVGVGIVAINSATAYSGDTSYVQKQIVFFIMGLVLMLIVMSIDYHLLANWYLIIYAGIIILLISVFFLGKNINGATRWIEIAGVQIQPSEFAKIGMILCGATIINKYNNRINQLWPILIIGAFEFIPFILVNKQPNLSTSIVIVVILVIQLFMSKIDFKYIITATVVSLLVVVIAFVYIVKNPDQKLIQDYQRNRIMSLVNGGDASADKYQTQRAVQAIGSGGLQGKGLYQGSISQLNYLPESHNDFIMAVIGEEFGFIGAVSVVVLLLAFILRGIWIARGAPDDLGRFIVVGYMGMIAMQGFVNMGVVTDLLPNTGIPIPFISYGGSSLWTNMMGLGLVLNVAMRREEKMF
ncbi:rod shape-determining protein RodA [Cellulosilyticum lentocellum]|uniref:Cell cycle protein n=1 Tax=Cellulosilyticum lentocellum (strain ATCC 49066 / DSM 5427 / NCIMB 11756 / RHM5) TaxID=642492 RepID=F2JQF3_CELLD|nr:rod shape-determining protein RodA [Cellulosilyticum lentocellum]ADZ83815.1 cell cycle protein [Cellulosilyticum lentocellum DSM 5427]